LNNLSDVIETIQSTKKQVQQQIEKQFVPKSNLEKIHKICRIAQSVYVTTKEEYYNLNV